MPNSVFTYHKKTIEYLESLSEDKQKELCQYFTPRRLQYQLIEKIPTDALPEEPNVLDPACGTGELLYACECFDDFGRPTLHGWEKDDAVAAVAADIVPSANITITNTIRHETDEMFDLIIGNPPYGEISRTDYINDTYEEIVYGRQNLYGLFMYKSLQHLRDNGLLAFIVPPSMNNGAFFEPLREYIASTCQIHALEVIEEDRFENVEQPVMLFVCEKLPEGERGNISATDFTIQKGDILLFSEKAQKVNMRYAETTTLDESGYEVTTGSIIGNKNEDKTHNTQNKLENTVPLIWSSNVTDGFSIGENDHTKPQYIDLPPEDQNSGPAIVVNRVIGRPGSGSISVGFIPDDTPFVAENHVNVITPKPDEEQTVSFTHLYDELNNPMNTDILRDLIGNTQLSKSELQYLFPIEPQT